MQIFEGVSCLKLKEMQMRNLGFVMIGLMLFVGSIHAQEIGSFSTEEKTVILTQWMSEELELTKDQVPRVRAINKVFSQGLEEAMATDGFRARLGKFRNQVAKCDKSLEGVLTKVQYKAFMDIKGNMRKEMKERAKKSKKG